MLTNSKLYEKIVAQLLFEEYGFETTIVPNAKIIGFISKRSRQIDVLVESKYGESHKRIIVEAKFQKRPIDIKTVEEFEGMMRDVNAQRGILVCPNGYTKSAFRRAQELITIRLLTQDEIDYIGLCGWDDCSSESCNGFLIWEMNPTYISNAPLTVTCSAKCDKCSKFNVWCWSCGDKFILDDEDKYQCNCQDNWFWLTSIEFDEYSKSVYLHMIYGTGLSNEHPDHYSYNYFTMNRRPIN